MTSRPRRLVVFTTHPIQYQAPWFRALAAEPGIDLLVAFSQIPDATEQGIGFGRKLEWDIPLRDGYRSIVLDSRRLPKMVPQFTQRYARGITKVLDDFRPDAAMILGWQELSLVQALLTCKRHAIPIILRGESNALRQRRPLVSFLHRNYLQFADAFLTIGRANESFYLEAGIPHDRIAQASYFVDNDRFRDASDRLRAHRSEIRHSFNVPEAACCFALVGKLEPKKCVMSFLDALRRASQSDIKIHGLIVGSGEQMEQAQSFADEHHCPATFAGFMNQSEISRAYVAADALVLPSDFGETWGLVVNEGMASGLPAIVSDHVGCSNDLVLDNETGLVFPFGDTGRLTAHLLRLARDPLLRHRFGSAARAHVCTNYSVDRAVKGTFLAIDIALNRRSAHAKS